MVDTLYQFTKQQGEYLRDYFQVLPDFGWFALQIQSDYSNVYVGWYNCENICVSEWQFTSMGGGKFKVKIDLNIQDAFYDTLLFARIYDTPQTVGTPLAPNIIGQSEPFVISKLHQNIHEFEYSNNELIDGIDYSNWKGYAYCQFVNKRVENPLNEKIYINSQKQRQKLFANLDNEIPIETGYISDYEKEKLNLISLHDVVNVDYVSYQLSQFTSKQIDKFSLSTCESKLTKTIYNYQNSNCN